jgi:hypothetical protein
MAYDSELGAQHITRKYEVWVHKEHRYPTNTQRYVALNHVIVICAPVFHAMVFAPFPCKTSTYVMNIYFLLTFGFRFSDSWFALIEVALSRAASSSVSGSSVLSSSRTASCGLM